MTADMLGPWELGKVHCADCLEAMKALPDGCVPMIWTDPPYGHKNNDDDLAARREAALGLGDAAIGPTRPIANDDRAGRDRVVQGMLAEAGRVLNRDCCCCCCGGGGGPDPLFARASLEMDVPPLEFFHAVVWDKGGLGMGWRYRRNYEFVLVAKRRGGKLLWATESSGLETANVVRIGKIIPSASQHPTQKPVELIKHFLGLHTKPGDLVLDPFAGAGSTGVACVETGRRFLGFEIDQHWAEVANARIQAAAKGVTLAEYREGQEVLFGGDE